MTNISKNSPIISSNATAPVNQQEPAKKYEFIDDCEYIDGHFLTRIRALRDFDDVKAGDLGGFIEKESNLSHEGNAWVYDDACVYSHARVFDNARVRNNAHVRGQVYDNAFVYGKVFIS